MNVGIDLIIENLGAPFEWITLLIFLVGGLLFFAKDFKIGLMYYFVGSAAIFIWFYEWELAWALPLTIFFMSLTVLALTLYAVNKTSPSQGGII